MNCGPLGSGMWDEIRQAVGPYDGWRSYNPPASGGGFPSAWPGTGSGPPPAGAWPMPSAKPDPVAVATGRLDDELRQYISGAQPGAWVVLWHEGENDLTPAVSKAMHAHAYKVVKATRPDLVYAQIVMAYTALPASSYYPLSQHIATRPRGGRLDAYGIDGYSRTTKQTTAGVFGAALAQIRSVVPRGRVGITECNSLPEGRAAWFQDCYEWARANAALTFFPFFFPEGYAGDGPYNWDPTDAATIRVLKGVYEATR